MNYEKWSDWVIPRIKKLEALDHYVLYVVFDDGKTVEYDDDKEYT